MNDVLLITDNTFLLLICVCVCINDTRATPISSPLLLFSSSPFHLHTPFIHLSYNAFKGYFLNIINTQYPWVRGQVSWGYNGVHIDPATNARYKQDHIAEQT